MSVNIPNITTDGLVFGYDSKAGSKFAPGPPGVNKVSSVGYTYGNQDGALFKTNYTSQNVVIPKMGARTSYSITTYNDYNGGSNVCCQQLFSLGGGSVSGGAVMTYQIVYRINDGYTHPNLMYKYEYGASGYITEGGMHSDSNREYLGEGWYHAWGQFTTNASTTTVYLYCYVYQYGVHNRFEIGGIQFTQGSSIFRPAQFLGINETRANTSSLLDLKGAATISVADISYDSSGVPYFDGTNDQINLDSYATTVPNGNITVEAIVKFTAMNTNKVIVAHGGNGSNDKGFLFQYENSTYGLAFAIYDNPNFGWARTGTGSAATQYLNQYIHMVGTYDNEYVRLYINGTLIQTTQFTGGFERQSTFRIGNEVNRSYYMTGEIPVVKLYNKTLTATQIKNNYNGYKGRYSLA
jgi:hypothetical protein